MNLYLIKLEVLYGDVRKTVLKPSERALRSLVFRSRNGRRCAVSYIVKIIWCSRWLCNPQSFEAVYCFICGRQKVAVSWHVFICLVLLSNTPRRLDSSRLDSKNAMVMVRSGQGCRWTNNDPGVIFSTSKSPNEFVARRDWIIGALDPPQFGNQWS